MWLRNLMYDSGLLVSKKGKLPTIVIGNLNTGGTGKTPHTIALANLLSELQPAILSRGYGRKTQGYIELTEEHTASDVGDEPLLYLKNTNSRVAVCEDRVLGIETLAKE
ncbi:MAG: tetraacyldisaccharide 4'-kinase, partial [Flavobacteriales bacterium]